MTDTSPVVITHPITDPYPVTVPLPSPGVNGTVSDSIVPEEEEPYTIKCICAFEDDDGNTVFCEGCETWQHIECYYHGRDVPDVHNCVDCEPRHLDGRRATERQRRLREQSDGGDRKTKRSGNKSHKKKIKEHGDHVNGFHHRSESGARDQPVTKKVKTNHRASGSISSVSGVPGLPPDPRKRAAASLSPIKTAGPTIPLYSHEFLHLYDHDNDYASMDSNLFVNLPLAADLASWVTEPTALARIANGRSGQDIFTWSGASLDRSRWPILSTESVTDSSVEMEGQHPTWKVLKTRDRVGKDEIVGEITGKIGLLRDYCLDPSNRWQELRHPEPFVFFHPQLPIYIDSRHEGSVLRYVRRSCRPNVTMKTYITNQVEYHFCFVAKEDIAPDSEITAMWYLDPQLFESTNGLVKQESSDSTQDNAAICISNVLAHFGGCACVPSSNCLLASVDRRRHPRSLDASMKQANLKRKKPKTKPVISPTANSRAGSETTKILDDDDQADSRSASDSVRGQTRSRDLTPTLQNPTENHLLGDTELSAREKRKIAAAEKKFQQLEQDQQTTNKRKKRASGQSTHGRERQSHSPPTGALPGPLPGARHGSPRKMSNSHSIPSMRSPLSSPQYVDSAIQTESDAPIGGSSSSCSSRRPSFVPLTQRLLKRCYFDRLRFENSTQPVSPQAEPLMSTDSSPRALIPGGGQPLTASTPSVSGDKEDTDMKDVDSSTQPSPSPSQKSHQVHLEISPSSDRGMVKPPLPFPLPSTAAHNARIPMNPVGQRRPELRVPLSLTTTAPNPPAASPGSAAVSTLSPTGDAPSQPTLSALASSSVAAPSPVKKKLSLGDYMIRRGTKTTPSLEKTQAQAPRILPPTPAASASGVRESTAIDPTMSAGSKAHGEMDGNKSDDRHSQDSIMKDIPGPTPASHLSPLTR
ncbi:putative PHD finger and SET domain protein [Aspergillus homomorphus CBS 101889]|uniref:Putative PHD finger and SET domain protein n=1 Tax=Aspergillus homomorphus (strain CBS 101889) TaxID=1450537 RepID=A0A395IBC8_ASPHC|nr:putative PHD finger and SET domain protein [Aspergillus homomorphus CBS 101889]RAL16433.1 putative PHD finger and SET domain protein [Aspergillus homomorphus CBS 101889]